MIANEDDNYMLKYIYKIKPGISRVEGSLSVIKQLDYPEDIIKDITHELDSR